jgi:hypothetical protein
MAGLRLNQDKCIFGIKKGKLLGCLVSTRGIEENPEKIAAIVNMKPLASKKQVQKLTGRLVALNRFISRSAEKGLPFFITLRSSGHFEWGHEQQQAFDEPKTYLIKLTTLSKPSPSTTLLLYLAASPTTVRAVLAKEKEHENKMKQFLVYSYQRPYEEQSSTILN